MWYKVGINKYKKQIATGVLCVRKEQGMNGAPNWTTRYITNDGIKINGYKHYTKEAAQLAAENLVK